MGERIIVLREQIFLDFPDSGGERVFGGAPMMQHEAGHFLRWSSSTIVK